MFRSLRRTPQLPDDFLFGVACADHQVEAYVPALEDIRDVWERMRKLTVRGAATDFWNRYPEDIALAEKLGCTAFRFSIAWSRVEPEPGRYDDAAFEHYRRVLELIRAAGMEPIVTLHHFTWPVHVEQRGGMTSDEFPQLFARYTAEVVNRLGSLARYWITFNEPTQLVYGYVKPWWEANYFVPPGLPEGATIGDQMTAVSQLMRNLFAAHTAARNIIKRANPKAMVGSNPLLLGLPGWLQRLVDWNATRIRRPTDFVRQGRRFAERALLERGEVDVVLANLTVTPERADQVLFSEVYYVAGMLLLVKADSTATQPADMQNKTVVVVKGSTAERDASRLLPGAQVDVVDNYDAALNTLDSSKADALLSDDTILRGLMIRHPDRYKLIGPQLTVEPYAAAVAQGNRDLLDAIDVIVRQWKQSGAWAESYARNIGTPAPAPPATTERALVQTSGAAVMQRAAARLQPGEQAPQASRGTALRRIQNRGYLVVAVKQDVPGFSQRDPQTGAWSGMEIDLAHAVAEKIFGDPSKVRFHPTETAERIPLLRSVQRLFAPLLRQWSTLSTALTSNWWHLGMAGKLPEFLCPAWCVGQQDFVGLDYYWGIAALRLDRIQRLLDSANGRFSKAPVWPAALYSMLTYHAKLFPNTPILIVENGCVDEADGVKRADYIRDHVREIQRAVRDGAHVTGYVCWSITSNREWGLPFNPDSDFGLHHIDLDTDPALTRVPTPAAETYREIIKQRGV
jgi:beta-glucosidase/6-phospho-beta-glucosidase/beta-galactosidase/ABC-type amino acid transport substrate-binding protein